MNAHKISFVTLVGLLIAGCQNPQDSTSQTLSSENEPNTESKPLIIFDTDANNELDDQHALAYLLFNGDYFTVAGITVNATTSGGQIENHVEEARRVMALCQRENEIPLLAGANQDFETIAPTLHQVNYDGHEAVDFIIEKAMQSNQTLILLAVGKLTNVALALQKEPKIMDRIKVVWLGSNYPDPGEYNQVNDIPAMNYILNTEVPFEIVTVRYGLLSGTDAVKVSEQEVDSIMPGLGPKVDPPIIGRHGGTFTTFGDYSVSLFEHIDYHSPKKERALFDLAAVAIIKNPNWANLRSQPAPIYQNDQWEERPTNTRKIGLWENFDRLRILEDMISTLKNPVLATAD